MSKRIFLFIFVNFLVILSLSLFLRLFHFDQKLINLGIKNSHLIVFCLVWGFGGSIISLLLSKFSAKRLMQVEIIDPKTYDPDLQALIQTVYKLSKKAGISKMPEVGLYQSDEINAFATGATKNRSLVALSSGLIQQMSPEQIYGVIGHEISHIANGDMVTMTLIQGIVNSFVLFFPRLISFSLTNDSKSGFLVVIRYFLIIALEIVFGILGTLVVCYFSRRREYRADSGSASICGKEYMVVALEGLLNQSNNSKNFVEDTGLKTLKIYGLNNRLFSIFSTHPSVRNRIRKLRRL
jgi:heat shock protein HtpX